MTVTTFPDRVAAQALDIAPVKLLLSVLAAPFFALGWTAGILAALVVYVSRSVAYGWHVGMTR